jgi:chromosome segregation ATPase
MPEEEKKQPQSATPETNANLTPADLAALKAELEEEKKLNAAAEAALAERDKRIAELQASISVVQQAGDTAMAELTQLKDAHAKAISKYLEVVKARQVKVPAGAPPRGEISPEGLSPRDKIAAGIQQKGGTT